MKYLLVLMVILTTQAFAESKKDEIKKAADIEKILRQQRELEADELLVKHTPSDRVYRQTGHGIPGTFSHTKRQKTDR